ncbi:hypothetical protein KIL84_019014 [Mauremys mutica]|uniref:Uncharacterized protein n=1 Tax=Mauremys mutica TaxID=74926 RepID=A0A9D3XW52_9SAUR|nr:hypothetical protein KIL84_019014 [Mauremys mutica]
MYVDMQSIQIACKHPYSHAKRMHHLNSHSLYVGYRKVLKCLKGTRIHPAELLSSVGQCYIKAGKVSFPIQHPVFNMGRMSFQSILKSPSSEVVKLFFKAQIRHSVFSFEC